MSLSTPKEYTNNHKSAIEEMKKTLEMARERERQQKQQGLLQQEPQSQVSPLQMPPQPAIEQQQQQEQNQKQKQKQKQKQPQSIQGILLHQNPRERQQARELLSSKQSDGVSFADEHRKCPPHAASMAGVSIKDSEAWNLHEHEHEHEEYHPSKQHQMLLTHNTNANNGNSDATKMKKKVGFYPSSHGNDELLARKKDGLRRKRLRNVIIPPQQNQNKEQNGGGSDDSFDERKPAADSRKKRKKSTRSELCNKKVCITKEQESRVQDDYVDDADTKFRFDSAIGSLIPTRKPTLTTNERRKRNQQRCRVIPSADMVRITTTRRETPSGCIIVTTEYTTTKTITTRPCATMKSIPRNEIRMQHLSNQICPINQNNCPQIGYKAEKIGTSTKEVSQDFPQQHHRRSRKSTTTSSSSSSLSSTIYKFGTKCTLIDDRHIRIASKRNAADTQNHNGKKKRNSQGISADYALAGSNVRPTTTSPVFSGNNVEDRHSVPSVIFLGKSNQDSGNEDSAKSEKASQQQVTQQQVTQQQPKPHKKSQFLVNRLCQDNGPTLHDFGDQLDDRNCSIVKALCSDNNDKVLQRREHSNEIIHCSKTAKKKDQSFNHERPQEKHRHKTNLVGFEVIVQEVARTSAVTDNKDDNDNDEIEFDFDRIALGLVEVSVHANILEESNGKLNLVVSCEPYLKIHAWTSLPRSQSSGSLQSRPQTRALSKLQPPSMEKTATFIDSGGCLLTLKIDCNTNPTSSAPSTISEWLHSLQTWQVQIIVNQELTRLSSRNQHFVDDKGKSSSQEKVTNTNTINDAVAKPFTGQSSKRTKKITPQNSTEMVPFLMDLWIREFNVFDQNEESNLNEMEILPVTCYDTHEDIAVSSERYMMLRHQIKENSTDRTDDQFIDDVHIVGSNDLCWWCNDGSTLETFRVQHDTTIQEQEDAASTTSEDQTMAEDATDTFDRKDDAYGTKASLCSQRTSVSVEVAKHEALFEKEVDRFKAYLSKVPAPRYLAKVRRILKPMMVQIVVPKRSSNGNCNDVSEISKRVTKTVDPSSARTGNVPIANEDFLDMHCHHDPFMNANRYECVSVHPLEKSLAEIWLDSIETRDHVARFLLWLAQLIPCKNDHECMMVDTLYLTYERYFGTQVRYQYQEIQNLILQTLRKYNFSLNFNGSLMGIHRKLEHGDIPSRTSCRDIMIKEENNFSDQCINKRDELFNEFYHDEEIHPLTIVEGNVIMTNENDGITEKQFLEQAFVTQAVLKNFPRYFIPWESRPRFARIKQFDTNYRALNDLRNVFFDHEGCLKRSVIDDVNDVKKHNFITFTNMKGGGAYDKRWQVPLRVHTARKLSITRSKVEEISADVKLIEPDKEIVHDMGLLIGGTTDQSLHHDRSRQWTCWRERHPKRGKGVGKDLTDTSPLVGWEANRLLYNRSMADKNAPSSFLIGLASGVENGSTIYVGVQKDQIERIPPDSTHCCIKNGMPDEKYRIVRENSDLVVLEIRNGCYFTGDFQHAGVRNVQVGSAEEVLLNKFFQKLSAVTDSFGEHQAKKRSQAVLDMLCSFKGLDRLTRLHFSTELKGTKAIVSQNAIGFDGCKENKASDPITEVSDADEV